jgi:hypothetical protein
MPDTLGISRLVHEGFFQRLLVSINHRQVNAHGAFGPPAPLLPFLERAQAKRCPLLSPKGAAYPSPSQRPGLNGHLIQPSPEGAIYDLARSHNYRSSSIAMVEWVFC